MALKSKIEWTEASWNPITGCSKISPGCKNCYAERMALRLQRMGQENYKNGFQVSVHKKSFGLPLKWKKPQMIFVNSMSDLFHKDIPENTIQDIFNIMNEAHWHTFQVLTKRSKRLENIDEKLDWGENIWLGVSIENEDYNYRLDHLRNIKAKIKFISFEPLIGSVGAINLTGIDWVIVGGESGAYSRSVEKEWVTEIRDQCTRQNVPFFFKQWGGWNKKKNGRLLDGQEWSEMPKTNKRKIKNEWYI